MKVWTCWIGGSLLAAMLVVVPFVHFRSVYAHSKRFREVVPGRVFRSGQMTVEGFTEMIREHHIRLVINVQDDYPDPDVEHGFGSSETIKESELCKQLGVAYLFIQPNLISRRRIPAERPEAIDRFLSLMDDAANYPVLIHCKAGLHRTGVLLAVYRMEYQNWAPERALEEMKEIGFGQFACSADNDYVRQYVLTYRPGIRAPLLTNALPMQRTFAFPLLPPEYGGKQETSSHLLHW